MNASCGLQGMPSHVCICRMRPFASGTPRKLPGHGLFGTSTANRSQSGLGQKCCERHSRAVRLTVSAHTHLLVVPLCVAHAVAEVCLLQSCALQSVPFNPKKLTVQYQPGTLPTGAYSCAQRRYTLTHNDLTGQLLLTVGSQYNTKQLSGWYSQLLRDEILAYWQFDGPNPVLHIECHVSGNQTWLAPPSLRDYIFRREMPLVSLAACFRQRRSCQEPYQYWTMVVASKTIRAGSEHYKVCRSRVLS